MNVLEAPHTETLPELDLSICAEEQIHIPGAIQPHGALLAARPGDLLVTHASANLGAILGIPAEAALGQKLPDLLGAAACDSLQRGACLVGGRSGHVDCEATIRGGGFHLRVHLAGRLLCVDIEPRRAVQRDMPVVTVQPVLESFDAATTRRDLCELAVQGLKTLTGYDRVMAYRLNEGGDGEVIAEACNPDLEPYRGLRYPASDIPPQARRQALLQRVCVIADARYRPVPMLVHPAAASRISSPGSRSDSKAPPDNCSRVWVEASERMSADRELSRSAPSADGVRLAIRTLTLKASKPIWATETSTVPQIASRLRTMGPAETLSAGKANETTSVRSTQSRRRMELAATSRSVASCHVTASSTRSMRWRNRIVTSTMVLLAPRTRHSVCIDHGSAPAQARLQAFG